MSYSIGLGGMDDATNVIKTEVAAIVNIDYDHMGFLEIRFQIAEKKVNYKEGGVVVVSREGRGYGRFG